MTNPMEIASIRSFIWRLGRRLYCWARRDVTNNPTANGEYWLVEKLLAEQSGDSLILIDVGANQGNWTANACGVFDLQSKQGVVYAFEPTQSTYTFLANRFKTDARVKPIKIALSDVSGEASFYVVGELAGTNSLHDANGGIREPVQTQRFDEFLSSAELEQVLFVKCDTEGHDMSVMRGAEQSLRAGAVEIWQFEYNHRWVANHAMLKDVFDFIEDKPYRLGKLYGNGIEIYDQWHPELERYFEGNYVLVRKQSTMEKLCSRMRFDASNVIVKAQ